MGGQNEVGPLNVKKEFPTITAFKIAILILVVAVTLGMIRNFFGDEPVIGAIIFAIAILGLSFFATKRNLADVEDIMSGHLANVENNMNKHFSTVEADMRNHLACVEKNISDCIGEKITELGQYPGIVSERETINMEKKVRRSVWIITPTFRLDLGIMRKTIAENLKRGVEYRYIGPNTTTTKTLVSHLLNSLNDNEMVERDIICKKIRFRFLEKCFIYGEVTIYDAKTDNLKAILYLPPEPFFDKYKNAFYISEREAAMFFQARFTSIWEKASEIPTGELF